MTWHAPDYTDVLEDRLRQARLDLLEDPRLIRGVQGGSALSQDLIERVIREKLGSAAMDGFEAIEASLRLAAQEYYASHSLERDPAAGLLEAPEGQLVPPPLPPKSPAQQPPGLSFATGIAFAGFLLLGFALYLLFSLSLLALVFLAILAVVPALILQNRLKRRAQSPREQLLDEYPAEICRHYVQGLQEKVNDYEQAVNAGLDKRDSHRHVA